MPSNFAVCFYHCIERIDTLLCTLTHVFIYICSLYEHPHLCLIEIIIVICIYEWCCNLSFHRWPRAARLHTPWRRWWPLTTTTAKMVTSRTVLNVSSTSCFCAFKIYIPSLLGYMMISYSFNCKSRCCIKTSSHSGFHLILVLLTYDWFILLLISPGLNLLNV